MILFNKGEPFKQTIFTGRNVFVVFAAIFVTNDDFFGGADVGLAREK